MKALVLDRPGTPDTLRITDIPHPNPDAGEVRVRVHAVALNPVDYKLAQRGHPAWSYPFVLGLDVAGTIDALGPAVHGWQVGERVFYHGNLARPGGYAEYAITMAHVLARIPDDVSFIDAAALPCAGFTAYQSIFHKLHVAAGQTVLVQGGAGGVGGFAVQLAAYAGATVIASASQRHFGYVQQLGAHQMIDYNVEDVAARVQALTNGRGVDGIVDTVSKASATTGLDMLAFGGGIACVAALPDFSRIQPFAKAVSVHEIALGGAHLSGDRVAQEDLARIGTAMIDLVRTQRISALVQQVIPLEAVPDGLQRLAERHVQGKIVAQVVA